MPLTAMPFRQHMAHRFIGGAMALSAVALSACATDGMDAGASDFSSRVERTLSAAGFQMTPANTPERQASLQQLPAHVLVAQPRGEGYGYVYADPDGCACLYVGNVQAYQSYQAMAAKQRIAQQDAEAAADLNMASMDWDLWGPYPGWYGWGDPFIVGGLRGEHFERGQHINRDVAHDVAPHVRR